MSAPTRRDHVPAPAPSGSRRRDVASLGVVTVVAVAAVGVVAVIDPNEPGHYPTCPFLALTGAWCPGCGSMRAVHAMAHGDLGEAFARNPLAVFAAVYLIAAWGAWVLRLTGRRTPSSTQIPPWAMWGLLALVLGFWVARNIPGWTWLSPA